MLAVLKTIQKNKKLTQRVGVYFAILRLKVSFKGSMSDIPKENRHVREKKERKV